MKRSSSILYLSLIGAMAAGCGNDAGTTTPTMDMGVMPDSNLPNDTTAPTIVAVTPADNATGQRSDVEVVFEFSEPMDRESVEEALDATSLGAVTLSWNAAGDTLTITPNAELAYATGDGDPADTDALEYIVTLAASASDLAGNPISSGAAINFATSFTTLKEISATLTPVAEWSRVLTPQTIEFAIDDPFYVGDNADDAALRSVLTFDISSLPEEAEEIVAASFTIGLLDGSFGDPFNDLSEDILMDHVTYGELLDEQAINAAFNASQTPLSHVGVLFTGDPEVIALDVTSQLDDDLTNRTARSDRSQYLVRFDAYTDQDGSRDDWSWVRNSTELHVLYLTP